MAEIPDDLFKDIPKNDRIIETFFKMSSHLDKDKNTVVSISGGSDSDCILDLVAKNGLNDKVKFVFFDTGLEYDATKQHIKELETRYGIYIYIGQRRVFHTAQSTMDNHSYQNVFPK